MANYDNNIDDDVREQHPSYGMVGFSRVHCSGEGQHLFASSIPTPTTIRLTVRRCESHRHLARTRYHGKHELIEVEMTPHQFAELLTSMNQGDGIPCTLRYIDGERQPEPPQHDVVKRHNGEFATEIRDMKAKVKKLHAEATARLADPKPLSKGDRAMIASVLSMVERWLGDSIPFIEKQFREAADKTIAEARAEIDAALTHFIHAKGMTAIGREVAEATGLIEGAE